MVRRSVSFVCLVCALAVIVAMPLTASATSYDVYTEGNISTSYAAIFENIVGKVALFSDYVFFRTSQYDYILLVGDLTFENGTFSAETATEYRICFNSGYNSTYTFNEAIVENASVTPGGTLVYSNLGSYPDLIDRGAFYQFAILVLLLICVFMYLIRSIFTFTLRRR